MAKKGPEYLQIHNFLGINTNTDPRRILPIKDDGGVAEATEMINMDITREGAMATSPGYEAVSSIAGTGGVTNLLNYEKNTSDRYLIITHADDHYNITPSATAWATAGTGDYGDEAALVGGVTYLGNGGATNYAIIGNTVSANDPQKINISNPMAALTGSPPDGYIMAVFMGRLFIANGHSLYYCAVEDEDDWSGGGTIRFNDIITGLFVEGERMHVFTRTYNQGVRFDYDDSFNLSIPLKEPYERKYGCYAHKTIAGVGSTAYYWSPRGVIMLGAEERYDDRGLPRPQILSKKIEPSFQFVNKAQRELATGAYIEEKQQYWLSVPYNETDAYNSLTFVYNENWDAWTARDGFYPGDLALFKNTSYQDELYFGSALEPALYKFNDDVYSYDGEGYTRRWKSKIFTMGNGRAFKEFRRIDIAGSMDAATEFFVTVQVDNIKKKYKIDNRFLLRDSFSDYIGDNWRGDAYLGGGAPSETRFKRFYAPLDFDKAIREGIELQITIENNAAEQPFKIDFLGIEYEMRTQLQVPRSRYVNTQIPT